MNYADLLYFCYTCKAPVRYFEIQCEDCNNAPFIDYLGAYE